MQPAPLTMMLAFLDVQKWRPRPLRRQGRRIRLFTLEAGSCEGCAMELVSLGSSVYPLEGSGFQRVRHPEDADWLLVTGSVTRSCAGTLASAWEAMPTGRSLIAVGDCAYDGGMWKNTYATLGGLHALSRVYSSIPGCPPSPAAILQALVELAEGGSSSTGSQASSASRRSRQ